MKRGRALIELSFAIETVKNRPSAKQPHKASGSPDFGVFPAGPAMLDSCGVHPKRRSLLEEVNGCLVRLEIVAICDAIPVRYSGGKSPFCPG
jgi:hypothetical protein